jgi:hypothetical protein
MSLCYVGVSFPLYLHQVLWVRIELWNTIPSAFSFLLSPVWQLQFTRTSQVVILGTHCSFRHPTLSLAHSPIVKHARLQDSTQWCKWRARWVCISNCKWEAKFIHAPFEVFGFSIKHWWVNVVWVYLNNCIPTRRLAVPESAPKSPTALLPPPRPSSYITGVQPCLQKVKFFMFFQQAAFTLYTSLALIRPNQTLRWIKRDLHSAICINC